MSQKDYYLILGVLPDAEDVVIKAAYRALIQRYHPDRYNGSAEEAKRKTIELNEAYEVLSNLDKRAAYDRTRKASQGGTSDYDDQDDSESYYSASELDEDWQLAVQYYPDLTSLESRLRRISIPLAIGFRQAMLTTKEFDHRQDIAKVLEQHFLETYFGSNPKVLEFALKLIFDGKKAGAKELNKTITILGSKADPSPVIERLTAKYYASEIHAERLRREAETAREAEAARGAKAAKWEAERPLREAEAKWKAKNAKFAKFYLAILMIIIIIAGYFGGVDYAATAAIAGSGFFLLYGAMIDLNFPYSHIAIKIGGFIGVVIGVVIGHGFIDLILFAFIGGFIGVLIGGLIELIICAMRT